MNLVQGIYYQQYEIDYIDLGTVAHIPGGGNPIEAVSESIKQQAVPFSKKHLVVILSVATVNQMRSKLTADGVGTELFLDFLKTLFSSAKSAVGLGLNPNLKDFFKEATGLRSAGKLNQAIWGSNGNQCLAYLLSTDYGGRNQEIIMGLSSPFRWDLFPPRAVTQLAVNHGINLPGLRKRVLLKVSGK